MNIAQRIGEGWKVQIKYMGLWDEYRIPEWFERFCDNNLTAVQVRDMLKICDEYARRLHEVRPQ